MENISSDEDFIVSGGKKKNKQQGSRDRDCLVEGSYNFEYGLIKKMMTF